MPSGYRSIISLYQRVYIKKKPPPKKQKPSQQKLPIFLPMDAGFTRRDFAGGHPPPFFSPGQMAAAGSRAPHNAWPPARGRPAEARIFPLLPQRAWRHEATSVACQLLLLGITGIEAT